MSEGGGGGGDVVGSDVGVVVRFAAASNADDSVGGVVGGVGGGDGGVEVKYRHEQDGSSTSLSVTNTSLLTINSTSQPHSRVTHSTSGKWSLCTNCCSWSLLKSLLLGQTLSVLICSTGVTSQMLHSDHHIYVPTAQSFLNYVLLCMTYTTMLACRAGDKGLLSIIRRRGWKYFLVALADVEANYLVVKAYHYTTLTSVQLLDCFTIPVVLLLSFLVLRVRYRALHIVSVGVCLIGIACLVWADILVKKDQGDGSNKLVGDLLCLSGATLYGVSNVAEEYVVRTYSRVEFLGMVGLFGSVINGIQLSVLERDEVASIAWTDYQVVLLLLGYALSLFLLYSIMPLVIKATSATHVNLSILSADFYTLLIGLLLFHFHFHILYFASFSIIIIGIILYSIKPVGARTFNADDGSQSYRAMEEDRYVVSAVDAVAAANTNTNPNSNADAADVELYNHVTPTG